MKRAIIVLSFIIPNLCFAQDSLVIEKVCDRIRKDSAALIDNQFEIFFEEVERHFLESSEPTPRPENSQILYRYMFRKPGVEKEV